MKDTPPYNVGSFHIDEGFRMMSRVEGLDPVQVKTGMRVRVHMHPGAQRQPSYPVFSLEESTR